MPVTTYTTIDGEIVSQDVNGTVHDLLPDPLGHTVGLIGSDQTIEYEFTYWPYEEIGSIEDVATALRYVGTLGYYSDDYGSPRVYVRARHYRGPYGRWLTVDPLWPDEKAYTFVRSNPSTDSDPSGLGAFKCERCAYQLGALYFFHEIHWCCHAFIHCLVCCVLNHEFDAECAIMMQERQHTDDPKVAESRMKYCKIGIDGNVPTSMCADHCRKNTPKCRTNRKCPKAPVQPYWPHGGHLPSDCYNCSPLIRFLPHPVLGFGG